MTIGRRRCRGVVTAGAVALVVACSGSGSQEGFDSVGGGSSIPLHVTNQVQEPVQLRYVFGRSVPITLGTVRGGEEADFQLRFSRAGDLRLMGEFLERRTGTSNPIMDLRADDRLELVINIRKELQLSRAEGR